MAVVYKKFKAKLPTLPSWVETIGSAHRIDEHPKGVRRKAFKRVGQFNLTITSL